MSRTATETASLSPPVSTPSPSVIGQYELIRALGRGGMGEVHLARDLRLGRLVAIKLLTGHKANLGARFLAEARTTALCNHENIVVIHEVGAHDGNPYMVLEYLEGQTLRQWLREHAAPAAGQEPSLHAPVPPGRAVELMLPVVRALAYAHERGIVHRDLKPDNIMLTRAGTIKVLDFGIAKLLAAPDPMGSSAAARAFPPSMVSSSAMLGTLPYMSPEQMSAAAIDHRCDIWAVGIMLFEMVTGRHPIPSRSATDLRRVADRDQPMPSVYEQMPDIGPLGAVIDRCLIKHLEHRTASARELLTELDALAPGRRAALTREDGRPFAGLAAFQEADADRFFGRTRDIDHIVTELRSRPLVAIVGPSGTGKSSLVRAGVIPALKRSGEGWDACIVRPGRQPLAALAAVLAQLQSGHTTTSLPGAPDVPASGSAPDGGLGHVIERLRAEPGYFGVQLRARASSKLRRILLFVDQFEELYTLGAPPDERAAFLACLPGVADDAASPLRVVLSMRSDFLDRLAEDRHLSAEVTRGLVLLAPLDQGGMREALTCPIEATEFHFESGALVDRMIDALDGTRGALPLLQFTAARLWELRDPGRRLLTEASYAQIGGVAGALASHADAVLAGMSTPRQALARTVLERLVTPERTRALVGMSELGALDRDASAVEDLVQHLAAMRLVVIERGAKGEGQTVELVHESLIERWPTLARWLDENQEDAAFVARLRGAAQEWEKRDRDEGLLWRGTPAREAQLWYGRYRGVLPAREQAFLAAVFAVADQAVRRRRRFVVGSMSVMALLLVGATVALVQIRQAQREADRQAEIARAQATERELARREAEAARQEAARQAEIARAQAAERELARQAAEQALRDAESAQRLAEAERARATQETVKTRTALGQAQRSENRAREAEGQARQAEGQARSSLEHAETAAAAEKRARQEQEALIERSLGRVTTTLSPAP